jgi:DNA-binding transcriptional regulator YiaG
VLLIDGNYKTWYKGVMKYKKDVAIPTLEEALNRTLRLPEDIKLIQEKSKLSKQGLARCLGVHRHRVEDWAKGSVYPNNPIIFMSITLWADRLRKSE